MFESYAHPRPAPWLGRQASCALPWWTVPWPMDPGEGAECCFQCWVRSVLQLPGVRQPASCHVWTLAVRASFSVVESKLWIWPLLWLTVTSSLDLSFSLCRMSMLGYSHPQRSLPNMTSWDVYLRLKSCSLDLDNGNVWFFPRLTREVGLDVLSLLFSVISKIPNL